MPAVQQCDGALRCNWQTPPRTEIEFWSGMIETRPGGAAVETIEEMVRASSLTEEKLDLLLQPELRALD
jgi:hypothetical protein